MNEKELEIFSSEKTLNLIIDKKFDSPVWDKLNSLLVKNENSVTQEELVFIEEVNEEIDDLLKMIILRELKRLFDLNGEPLKPFIESLNMKQGEEQIKMIDDIFKGESIFWAKVETDLIDECLNPLVKDLKISIAKEAKL